MNIEKSDKTICFVPKVRNFTPMLKVFYLKMTEPAFAGLTMEDFRPWMGSEQFLTVSQYRSDKVRREKCLGEWLVCQVFIRLLGLLPRDYVLRRTECGKPYACGLEEPFFFNISHSGEYLVCACSDQEIGIDLEKIGLVRLSLARRFFHSEEIRRLEQSEGERCRELFFIYWTVKESFLKYVGTGLRRPLSSFAVIEKDHAISIQEDGHLLPVRMRECFVDSEYKCFVCSETEDIPDMIRLSEWMALPKKDIV